MFHNRSSNLTKKKNHSYAPGVVPQSEAAKEGYSQNLWLLGPEHALTEVGTMNLFVALKKADGCKSLIIIFLFRVVKTIGAKILKFSSH